MCVQSGDRHLYARVGERMNAPSARAFTVPAHFFYKRVSVTSLLLDWPIFYNHCCWFSDLSLRHLCLFLACTVSPTQMFFNTQVVWPYKHSVAFNGPFHHQVSPGDPISPLFVTFLRHLCLPEDWEQSGFCFFLHNFWGSSQQMSLQARMACSQNLYFFPLRNSHLVIFLLLTSFWGQYDPSLSLLLVNIRGWNKSQLFTFHFLNLVTLFIVSFVRSWTSILYLVFRKYSQSLLCLDVVYPLYGAAQTYREDYSKQFWKYKKVAGK